MKTIKNKIVVSIIPETKMGSIIIPDAVERQNFKAIVEHVGDSVKEIKVGDKISFGKNIGEDIEHEDAEYRVLKESQVTFVYEKYGIRALGKNIIISQDEAERITKAGIIIPDTAQESPLSGTIISVGAEVDDMKIGDQIAFGRLCGRVLEYDDQKYVMIFSNDVQFRFDDKGLYPLDKNILVEQEDMERQTESGILINVLEFDQYKPNVGKIKFVGKNVETLKIGDRVAFSMYAGRKARHRDEDKEDEYILMAETEVFATVPDGADIKVGGTQDHKEMIDSIQKNLGEGDYDDDLPKKSK